MNSSPSAIELSTFQSVSVSWFSPSPRHQSTKPALPERRCVTSNCWTAPPEVSWMTVQRLVVPVNSAPMSLSDSGSSTEVSALTMKRSREDWSHFAIRRMTGLLVPGPVKVIEPSRIDPVGDSFVQAAELQMLNWPLLRATPPASTRAMQ